MANRLRQAILEGRLKPGARLLQAELAHELQVSTTPVREAIVQLAHEGLVDLDDFRGATVHLTSREEIDQIYQVRLRLLPLGVNASMAGAKPERLAVASDLLRRMTPTVRTSEWTLLNRDFHKALDECAGPTLYSQIMVRLADIVMLYVGSLFDHSRNWTEETAEHHRILAAYVDRNEAAAIALLTEHFEKTWKNVIQHIETLPSDPKDHVLPLENCVDKE